MASSNSFHLGILTTEAEDGGAGHVGVIDVAGEQAA